MTDSEISILLETSDRLTEGTETDFHRYLHPKIDWEEDLLCVKGPKGTGKTTLILQHIKETFGAASNVAPLKRGGGVNARVWDDKNVWFPDAKDGGALAGTTGWIAQSYEFTSGPETNARGNSYLSIDIRQATGTVWIDDVRLDELK